MYGFFAAFLRDGEIKTVLQAILRAQKDVTQLQKLRRCVNLSRRSYVPVAGKTDVFYYGLSLFLMQDVWTANPCFGVY